MRILGRPALATSCTFQPPQRLRIFSSLGTTGGYRYSTVTEKHGGNNYDESERRSDLPRLPFRFETGIGAFAKRPPRPFPPPFLSPPSVSFSDPLSTHNRARAVVNGERIRGCTNGDDAVYASDFFICANDGVGAWAARPRGHAGLWARLILHFWSSAIEEELVRAASGPASEAMRSELHPVTSLQTAYNKTLEATAAHNWQGTTTACGAQLYFKPPKDTTGGKPVPLLYVINLGDCQIMVLRPGDRSIVFKTKEQWHWFDCPRQLGTNSPDTPKDNAVLDTVELQVGDVVLAMSDGVIDNLWEHEIVDIVTTSIANWENSAAGDTSKLRQGGRNGGMRLVAQDLVSAAKAIALDPYAQSPFMEHAIEEGLASEGVDAEMVADSCRFKMDLTAALERTVHGKVKPLITQCEIRKLYERKAEPGMREAIDLAKSYERRRCNHRPEDYPKPLSTLECMSTVVDHKGNGENKHRYVVASQSQEVRRMLRGVRAVPLIYIKRSVMILEPMADDSAEARMREEKAKFRAELKRNSRGKRKRGEGEDGGGGGGGDDSDNDDEEGGGGVRLTDGDDGAAVEVKKRKNRGGPKEPNPLSMLKSKKKKQQQEQQEEGGEGRMQKLAVTVAAETTDKPKRKRRRKAKASTTGDEANDRGENGHAGSDGSEE